MQSAHQLLDFLVSREDATPFRHPVDMNDFPVSTRVNIERFSIECGKTRTTANQDKETITWSQRELKINPCKRPQARENASNQVVIGFSLASDWLRWWREFSRPITERSKAKLVQSRVSFTQLKTAQT